MKKNHKQTKSNFFDKHNRLNLFIIIVVIIIFIIIVVGSGYISYTAALIRCGGKPIITESGFFGDLRYERPGDGGYGPNLFFENRYYCTEQEAVNSGARGPEGSLSDIRDKKIAAEHEEAEKFYSNKISFVAYTPSYLPKGYTKEVPKIVDIDGKQVIQYLVFQDKKHNSIRQGVKGSSYSSCNLSPCIEVGKASNGELIYRSESSNNGNVFWGITINDTFINIETSSELTLTLDEITKMFSSLEPL